MKVRDVILSAIFCLFLLGPCCLWAAQTHLHLELSSDLTSENSAYLSGGYEEADLLEHFSLKGFLEEKFQDDLNTTVENSIPYRAAVLLQNAAMQRNAIAASNMLFNFEVYPTFYNSTYCYLPGEHAIMRMPAHDTSNLLADVSYFADNLLSAAAVHPEITFNVCIADLSSYSSANPARSLLSDPPPSTREVVNIIEKVNSLPNVHIVDVSFDNANEYFRHYYTSDHHWSGYGAHHAFELLDGHKKKSDLIPEPNPALLGRTMNGSSSRNGLMLLFEEDSEPQLSLSDMKIQEEYDAAILSSDPALLLDENPELAEFDFYHLWYGPSAYASILNSKHNTGSALVIGDSYTSALQWLIAQNYHTTFTYLDCHGSYKGNETLEDRIIASKCDTIFFVMAPTGIQYLKDCYPNYWDLEVMSRRLV